MKIKVALLAFTVSCCALFGAVEKSIIPCMNQLTIKELNKKLNAEQMASIESLTPCLDQRVRVMSFNMLFNIHEAELEPINRWKCRKERVVEYVQWAHPDVIGSQELQATQLDDLLAIIGHEYGHYGAGIHDGARKGDIPAIFYRKDRLDLLHGQTFYFSETPEINSNSPFGNKNTFVVCQFKDKGTGRTFCVVNTHLAFGNINKRYYEACKLRDFLLKRNCESPLLITGDFNTFPLRQELDLPFYDGDHIERTIENGRVADSLKMAHFGHVGPISSTNFCCETKKSFCSYGEPGVILDHIFVSDGIQVLIHGIDAATVDGHFLSDHFPVIADVIIENRECQMANGI